MCKGIKRNKVPHFFGPVCYTAASNMLAIITILKGAKSPFGADRQGKPLPSTDLRVGIIFLSIYTGGQALRQV